MAKARAILVCALPLLAACRLPPAEIEARVEATPPAVFHESENQRSEPPPLEAFSPITHGECPADNSKESAVYLGGAVTLPLPRGVTTDNFIEFTPDFARLASAVESTNCHEGWPGAMITFMALAVFDEVPGQASAERRAALLEAFGYAHATMIEGGEPAAGLELWVYDVPPTDELPDPATMLLALRVVDGRVFVLVYECHSNAWSVMVNTFVDSAVRASFRPAGP
jgi:hypothetical protein